MRCTLRFYTWLLPLALAGCGYISTPPIIQTRDKHYLSARSVPPIRVLPGMSSAEIKNNYPIPDRQYPESAKVVSITPPGLN